MRIETGSVALMIASLVTLASSESAQAEGGKAERKNRGKPTPSAASAPATPESAGIVWKRIPKGTFTMGCVAGDDRCGDEDPHTVTLTRDFDIAETETTRGSYRQCVSAGTCKAPGEWPGKDNEPVVNVLWSDAVAFCGWVGGRLPTEAEWEYAARGGKDGLIYPNGNSISHDDANYTGTEGRDKWKEGAPVQSFAPNGYGLYDMAGNVWEWVNDWHGGSGHKPLTDPKGPPTGVGRMIRGGSWYSFAYFLRVSHRVLIEGDSTVRFDYGFRCVREVA